MTFEPRFLWLVLGPLLMIFIAVADWVVYRNRGDDETLSRTLLRVQARWRVFAVVVAFSLGVLVGHLFVPQHLPCPE